MWPLSRAIKIKERSYSQYPMHYVPVEFKPKKDHAMSHRLYRKRLILITKFYSIVANWLSAFDMFTDLHVQFIND